MVRVTLKPESWEVICHFINWNRRTPLQWDRQHTSKDRKIEESWVLTQPCGAFSSACANRHWGNCSRGPRAGLRAHTHTNRGGLIVQKKPTFVCIHPTCCGCRAVAHQRSMNMICGASLFSKAASNLMLLTDWMHT